MMKVILPEFVAYPQHLHALQGTLAGIELMHMIKKKQLMVEAGGEGLTAAEQFYTLAS